MLLQTVNAQEDMGSRLQRLKLESEVVKRHNERMENKAETGLNKQSADAVADLEVCDVINLTSSTV